MIEVVIFVDIDGVLLAFNQSREQKITWEDREKVIFNKESVELLNKLLVEYDAKIVLSTSWARGGLESCKRIFEKNGIDSSRIHEEWITPRRFSSHRSMEIRDWFDSDFEMTSTKKRAWIALDDDPTLNNLPKKNRIWIEFLNDDCVFNEKHYKEAKKKLDKQLKR